jgi:diguanylate cyclase (GGDEF)-like protein
MTGFYSEKFLQEGLEMELLRSERYERQLTLLLFEFDIPQKYHTDMFYHVFKRICKEVDDHTRRMDVKVRMGNRVLIVLPETDAAGAQKAAEKICETLSAVEFFHSGLQEFFHIDVNYSIAVFPIDGEVNKELMSVLNERLKKKAEERQ